MAFVKGQRRPPGAGRKAGTPNRTTLAAKAFLEKLCDDPKVQAVVRRKVLRGETAGFFKAIDKIVPDAPKTLNVNERAEWYMMPEGDDVAES